MFAHLYLINNCAIGNIGNKEIYTIYKPCLITTSINNVRGIDKPVTLDAPPDASVVGAGVVVVVVVVVVVGVVVDEDAPAVVVVIAAVVVVVVAAVVFVVNSASTSKRTKASCASKYKASESKTSLKCKFG